MSGEILLLAHRLPFPPDRGDRIRSCNVLKALADLAPVHVGCFIDGDDDRVHMGELLKHAASWCVVKRGKPLPIAGVEALLRGEPISLSAFRSKELSRWVDRLTASGRISAIYVFSGQMGQFVPASWIDRLVVDLVDVDSAKFEAYAKEAGFPQSWVHEREGRLLSQVEAGLAARAEHTLLVSEAEAELLRSRTGTAKDIRAMGNGIDADGFAPDADFDTVDLGEGGPHFVFTGQMDYPPNVQAVTRMTQRIMPEVRHFHSQARFHIVGRVPSGAVRKLDGVYGTRVWGSVADMRPFLAAADAVVAPLSIARGVQNKVLEAMAMARPVVLSPQAATGILARSKEHFLIAEDDASFTANLLDLSKDPGLARQIGNAARRFVMENQSWPAMLAQLPGLMGFCPEAKAQRDAA